MTAYSVYSHLHCTPGCRERRK